jgi:hypothetical protein
MPRTGEFKPYKSLDRPTVIKRGSQRWTRRVGDISRQVAEMCGYTRLGKTRHTELILKSIIQCEEITAYSERWEERVDRMSEDNV